MIHGLSMMNIDNLLAKNETTILAHNSANIQIANLVEEICPEAFGNKYQVPSVALALFNRHEITNGVENSPSL